MTLQEFFSDESKWGKGTDPNWTEGQCCLSVACNKITNDDFDATEKLKRKIVAIIAPRRANDAWYELCHAIYEWNDAPERTFADIRKLIEGANV
jgi:hypothetical protein